MGGCSSNPCQSSCCPNPPGHGDPKSNCAICRMDGYDDDCNTDGQHTWCNKKRCWTPDQIEDPYFMPWSLCGLNGADPPESIIKKWCSLPGQKDNWYCKTILKNPVECKKDAPWYLCLLGKLAGFWMMIQDMIGSLLGSACDSVAGQLPTWAQFLATPICWLSKNPMVVAVLVGLIAISAVVQPFVNIALLAK